MEDPLEVVNARVAAMPAELRQQLLRRAGVSIDAIGLAAGASEPVARKAHSWGFPTNLPHRQRLAEYLEHQAAAAEEQQMLAQLEAMEEEAAARAQQGQGQRDQRGEQPPPPLQQPQQQQQRQRPILLELLQQSRTFQSPDCADAMAEALGVADLHRWLRGSLLYDAPREAAVQQTRSLLRAALRGAWSHEALRRGVALAKAGDLSGALPCYDQALQLDADNADALVARGAALANQRQWQRASDDLEAALQLQPEHLHARLYLDAVQTKAAAGGVQLLPLQSRDRHAAEDGANGLAGHPQDERQEQQQPRSREREPQAAHAAAAEGQPAWQAWQQQQQRGPPPAHYHSHAQLRRDLEGPGDGREGRKRRRGSSSDRSRSRSRSRGGRQQRQRRRSRSEDRRRSRSRSSRHSSISSGISSSSSDSEAEVTAARLAAAQQQGTEGGAAGEGMDVATALQIVASHYRSKRGGKEKKEKEGKAKQRGKKGGGSRHHKHRHKRKKERKGKKKSKKSRRH